MLKPAPQHVPPPAGRASAVPRSGDRGNAAEPRRGRRKHKHLTRLPRSRLLGILDQWEAIHMDPERLRRHGLDPAAQSDFHGRARRVLELLLALLRGHIETADSGYRSLYLDERVGFLPTGGELASRQAWLREVVLACEDALCDSLGLVNAHSDAVRTLLRDVHAPLIDRPAGNPVRFLLIGDCLMGDLRRYLPWMAANRAVRIDVHHLYFSAAEGRDLSTDAAIRHLSERPVDLIALSFLTYAGLPAFEALLRNAGRVSVRELEARVVALVGTMRSFLERIREHTDAPCILHNASGLPMRRWRQLMPLVAPLPGAHRTVLAVVNDAIMDLARHLPNTLLLDERALATRYGYRRAARAAVPRSLNRLGLFHPSRFGECLSVEYHDIAASFDTLRKTKVLLVDFDNTLWEGVMADGAVRHWPERSHLLRRLKEGGMLLVAVSKNSPESIRWAEMGLQPADFVLHKIGWDLKVRSIAAAAQELDLGLDSFVFLDDSPEERALVQHELPDVTVFDAHDPRTWKWLERLLSFPNTRDTEEARARTEMYRAQAQRKEAQAAEYDYPAMMQSLELRVSFGTASAADLPRVTELIQRTNQFNTTTRRYDRTTLTRFMQDPTVAVYVAELRDRFGSMGLVAVVIVKRDGNVSHLDSFVMSCRAMGFALERLTLGLVMQREGGDRAFHGEFIRTDRNTPAARLFAEAGFTEKEPGHWWFRGVGVTAPGWFRVLAR